jgi:hypothetical protein
VSDAMDYFFPKFKRSMVWAFFHPAGSFKL